MMLSPFEPLPPRKKIFVIRQSTMNTAARIEVDFVKKSDVRRTPNIVPTVLPPREPESPEPLLDCSKTTPIRKIETIISIRTKKVNILLLIDVVKY